MKLYSTDGIKKARKRKRLTQEQLASKMGVHLKSVMNWEQGVSRPGIDTLLKLSRVLDCDLDYLIGGLDEPTHDLQFIREATGLSEKAITELRKKVGDIPVGELVNHMVESENFYSLMTEYKVYLDALKKLTLDNEHDSPFELSSDGHVILSCNEATHHFMRNVVLKMQHICEEDYWRTQNRVSKKSFEEKPNALSKLALRLASLEEELNALSELPREQLKSISGLSEEQLKALIEAKEDDNC